MRSLTQDIYIVANKKDRISFRELWLYRELLYYLAERDIKVRYKQTVLGAGWAILQPLLSAAILPSFLTVWRTYPRAQAIYPTRFSLS